MKLLICAVALAVLPPFVRTSGPPRSPELAARCLWAERGWRSEALGLDSRGESGAIAGALAALAEHRRLHGWGSLDGGEASWMVSRPAACPPAALGEFALRELPVAPDELVPVYRELGFVLARNRVVEGALRFLDAARNGRERVVVLRDVARVLFDAKEWERALDALVVLETAASGGDAALREEASSIRARCLLELGRVKELEVLCAARITAGGELEPTCRWIELLLEGWERAGMPPQPQCLIEVLFARFAGRSSLAARIAQQDMLWQVALRHRHLLGLDEPYAFPHVVGLLDAGDHREDVLERLGRAGPDALDALIAAARALSRDDPRERRLHDVLAATGDERVRPILEARFPDAEDIAAKLCAETWRTANALRRDLAGAGR